MKIEKSAARLYYEANCNRKRERYFIYSGLAQAAIFAVLSYKAGTAVEPYNFSVGISSSVLGAKVSDYLEVRKVNQAQTRAEIEHVTISRSDVHKGHLIKRNLYTEPAVKAA